MDISKIESHLEILEKICKDFEHTTCGREDFLGIVLIGFYERLTSHLKSIRLLKDGRDHLLITRSAVEGISLLKWMLNDNDLVVRKDRAKKYVQLWLRVVKERHNKMGDKADPNHVAYIDKMLRQTDGLLSPGEYNDLYVDFITNSFIEPKLFLESLTGFTSFKALIEAIPVDGDIYKRTYSSLSGFHHWNCFYMYLDMDGEGHVVYSNTYADVEYELSLMAMFVSIAETAQQLSIYFHKNKESEIQDLAKSLGVIS